MYKMNHFKMFLVVLVLFTSASGYHNYPSEVKLKGSVPHLVLTMKRPNNISVFKCEGSNQGRQRGTISRNSGSQNQNTNISCEIPLNKPLPLGKWTFKIWLHFQNRSYNKHFFNVEFRKPVPEIDCPNYIDGTIYAYKNTTITCECRLRDIGFPPGHAVLKKNSTHVDKAAKELLMAFNINDNARLGKYECAGESLLYNTTVGIENITALPETYPYITTEQRNASTSLVICNGTYPKVNVTLTCGKGMSSSGEQTTTLEIPAEMLRGHTKLCACQAVMGKNLSFNSTHFLELPDVTDNNQDNKNVDEVDNSDDVDSDESEEDDETNNNADNKNVDGGDNSDDNDSDEDEEDGETTERTSFRRPELSFEVNGNKTLTIEEGLNMTLDCQIESEGQHIMTIQRDGDTLVEGSHKEKELTIEATCKKSGEYTCMATNIMNVNNTQAVDVYVVCAPVLEKPDNVTPSFSPSNDSTVRVEVEVAGFPEPNDFELFKEAEREKRSVEEATVVPASLYNATYTRSSPGHGTAGLVVMSNHSGKYIFVIKNGKGPGLKYRFRVKNKEERVNVTPDLGINIGGLAAGLAVATLIIIAIVIACIIKKKYDWLMSGDDDESKMDTTRMEIFEFPSTPTTDKKPSLCEEEIKEEKEQGTKDV